MCYTFLIGCNGQNNMLADSNKNASYLKYKKEFDYTFISHFPKNIASKDYSIICNTNIDKNDVGLILYSYNLTHEVVDSIIHSIKDIDIIGEYNSEDSCLIVVNRFETYSSQQNYSQPAINDSAKINKNCYKNHYPIPNFIDYVNPDSSLEIKLDKSFEIYVLDARSGKYFEKYDLHPAIQMPENWKNGYSKGIAISKHENTIIYWSIIW